MNYNPYRETFEAKVYQAQKALDAANAELAAFESRAENWLFDTLYEAGGLEEVLLGRAAEDCEGSYNVGDEEYRQECLIAGKKYVAVLYDIEYNRHDKRYYYLDGHEFRIDEVNE